MISKLQNATRDPRGGGVLWAFGGVALSLLCG